MLLRLKICFVPFWTFLVMVKSDTFSTNEIIEFHEPSYCAVDEYFNVNQLKCITCDSEKNLIPSPEGFSCVCNEKSKIKKWDLASFPVCEPCKENEIPTKDQIDCIRCPVDENNNSTGCEDFLCPPNTVTVYRSLNGSLSNKLECLNCEPGTVPSPSQETCLPCKEMLLTGSKHKCECDKSEIKINGLCVKNVFKNWENEKTIYTITYDNGKKVDSQFFRDNFLRGMIFCKSGNEIACQLVGNLCVMVMYNEERSPNPCSIFKDRKKIPTSNTNLIPWLYYNEGDAPIVLSRKRITAHYDLNRNSYLNMLNLTGIIYNPNGSFKEIRKVAGHTLQLCPASWKSLDTSFRFSTNYFYSCYLPAKQVLAASETEFMDLFLSYKDGNRELLQAVPALVLNLKSNGYYKNKGTDRTQWQLVRRIFLVDKVSGQNFEEEQNWEKTSVPEVARYAKSITLNVRVQGRENEGRIFVPYIAIEYGEITKDDVEKNNVVPISFKVEYQMDNNLSHALEVSIGVFSGIAVVWSGIRAWGNTKRSGRLAIDFFTVGQLIVFTCGNLANVFFLNVFCTSLYYFVFFKGQTVVYVLLPTKEQEEVIRLYLIFAFFFKAVEIGNVIYSQIRVDIFFIDWERPRARNLISRNIDTRLKSLDNSEEQPVSIWRTCFVANEWNEIQTKRKINLYIHLVVTVLILKVGGLEYWALADPELYCKIPPDDIGKEFSFICLFVVGVSVYILVYAIQIIFVSFVYERFIKNGIQEFVDICSMANISVFILAFENYGYYIHGRSSHGFADTDMQNIINQLIREEEDLVGHRGLLPGTDQQTFEMTVPTQLRAYYRKVMEPATKMSAISKKITVSTISGRLKIKSENIDRNVQAYHTMNRFLSAFLEHALKDLDYEVREKIFTESLLGIEFADPSEKGVFYSDNGHSFDQVLFYGNEFSLFTFDLMSFSLIVALFENYLVAGIVTAFLSYLVTIVKDIGGKKNLAKKTLIDERFLI